MRYFTGVVGVVVDPADDVDGVAEGADGKPAEVKAVVDALKFQTFKAEEYVNEKDKKRFNRLKKFELSNIDFAKLAKF